MDERVKYILEAYGAISVSDALIKILKLNSIYLKAKKASTNLKYRNGLMWQSKQDLKLLKQMHLYAILNLCKYSLIPVLNFKITSNIFNQKEIFIEEYIDMFNYIYNGINEDEELERSEVATFLASIYEDFNYALPESYKGHKLSDATIRISRKEMIKFLKKNKIILKETSTDDEYTNYDVICLKKVN